MSEGTSLHKTACILCSQNCGIEVEVDGRRLTRVHGDRAHPTSLGYACEKAQKLDRYQNAGDRLTSPLRRRADGSFEAVSWDTAIAEVAARLGRVRDEHGGDTIFYYGGGGQGNHLGGAYSGAFLKVIGSRYRSSALAQEKTGEAWVDAHLYAGHTRGEFEHAEVSVFVGKNPWMSQSFPRARTVLNEIARDPARSMLVIDPVITDTAKMADFHLRVRPGTDAWCLAALAAVLVQENVCDAAFLADHVTGFDALAPILAQVPVDDYAARCGVDAQLLRTAARRIAAADSVAVFEDLGVQQAPNSTVSSYLNKLLWILTGNFAKRGAQHLHSAFAPLFRYTGGVGRTPVTGAPIISGLIPSNVVPQEIATDHPDRFRAMIVESSNPAHSLADSAACRAAFAQLELLVVVDVAMTETARLAHYVLPAASQFEKTEATFFNLEFPHNTFQLRHPMFEPLDGTLPEPEIWSRLVRALGVVDESDLAPLRRAAAQGLDAYAEQFLTSAATSPMIAKTLPYVLYETLGPTLPDGLAGAAALWGLAQKAFLTYPEAVTRAGHASGNALFEAILASPSGVTFTVHEYPDDFALIGHDDRKIHLDLPEMIDAYIRLHEAGFAHSVESWQDGRLVGGLYGVSLGGCFFGESMFARTDDASKVAFVVLARRLHGWGFPLIDCQVQNEHLLRFGVSTIPRAEFQKRLHTALELPTRRGPWTLPAAEPAAIPREPEGTRSTESGSTESARTGAGDADGGADGGGGTKKTE